MRFTFRIGVRLTVLSPRSAQLLYLLVVPLDKARFAINAANARWGSLFDALYGTNALGRGLPAKTGSGPKGYDAERGNLVFKAGFEYLDKFLPLTQGVSWKDVCGIKVRHYIDSCERADDLVFAYKTKKNDGSTSGEITRNCLLKNRAQFVGSTVNPIHGGKNGSTSPRNSSTSSTNSAQADDFKTEIREQYCFLHNGLHIILVLDRTKPAGKQSLFGLSDIILESATTAIMDLEDSVAAVDAEDKSLIYRNWVGLMQGNISVPVRGKKRSLRKDLVFRKADDGGELRIPGRAVLLIRNVGIHMMTDAVLYRGREVPEGLLDLICTVCGSLHDIFGRHQNSRKGSIYIVKPKMHGPEEARFVVETFERLEQLLNLPKTSIKIGIMDEERRTSVNLRCVLRPAAQRVFFINTGFLDRCGDEIHTCFRQGAVLPKGEFKSSNKSFLHSYEKRNVQVGVQVGLHLFGQIGKGMWAEPDNMGEMMRTKLAHPQSAANTAWVPGPVAGVLHALHYHECSVEERQAEVAIGEYLDFNTVLVACAALS